MTMRRGQFHIAERFTARLGAFRRLAESAEEMKVSAWLRA